MSYLNTVSSDGVKTHSSPAFATFTSGIQRAEPISIAAPVLAISNISSTAVRYQDFGDVGLKNLFGEVPFQLPTNRIPRYHRQP